MNTVTALLVSMVPLYVLVGLGFVAKRWLNTDSRSLASILVYILAPLITFYAANTTPLVGQALFLPAFFLMLALCVSWLFYGIGGLAFGQGSARQFLLAATAGSGNAGYFGLGLALVLFPKEQVNLVVLSVLGFIFYMHTLGFYLTARGKFSVAESLVRLAKLPVVYAFVLGLVLNALHVHGSGAEYAEFMSWLRGSYTVLGMMVVGLSVATITAEVIDFRFTVLSLCAKFIVWPLFAGVLLLLAARVGIVFSPEVVQVVWLLSIVPIATNTVTYAHLLGVHSDVSAVAVLVSTLLAVLYVPIVWPLLFRFA
ncbi:MAG: AEC family transporter [Candidatus Doudnabacteria bacterium]|nr:AEC family transporter [Candidatus Doudnabacteria bacterium]